MANACALISASPPIASTIAAAAIALAEPISAWQPPSAPEQEALFATTKPKAPAVNNIFNCVSSSISNFCLSAWIQPGRTPAEPAVGVAQIKPNEAFTSLVAIAAATPFKKSLPVIDLPLSIYSWSFLASPPVSPVLELTPAKPSSTACIITFRFLFINFSTAERVTPFTSISCSIINSETGLFSNFDFSTISAKLVNILVSSTIYLQILLH